MDFSESTGDGWEVLHSLAAITYWSDDDADGTKDILLWMLKLSSPELRTNLIEENYACLLFETYKPYRNDITDLLLSLGSEGLIDAVEYPGHYPLLHKLLASHRFRGDVSILLTKAPNLHRLAIRSRYNAHYESPTSLAMYSSYVFADWLCGLVAQRVDLEDFVDQELQQNPMVHAGWHKKTLLALFDYGYQADLDCQVDWTCSDCFRELSLAGIQPHWRLMAERIKQGLDPENLTLASPGVGEVDSADVSRATMVKCCSSDLALEHNTTKNVSPADLKDLPSESESEDSHGYPAMIQVQSECIYDRDEVVCMDCWLHCLRTGTRGPSEEESYPLSEDESSEDEFSPFHIHS